MSSAILLNLVSCLKLSISHKSAHRAGYCHTFTVAAAFLLSFACFGQATTASGPRVADAGTAVSGETSQGSQTEAGTVAAGEEAVGKSEEALLKQALLDLKENRLNEAINYLGRLKEAYPDNDDYVLLYRTALRKKNSSDSDSQKWYSYVRSLDNKNDDEKHSFLNEPGEKSIARGEGRINELKRETWLVLTTGKYKSANEGRRINRPLKQTNSQ